MARTKLDLLSKKSSTDGDMLRYVEKIDDICASLERDELIQKHLLFFLQETQSENVLWFTPGNIDYYLNELWKVQSLVYPDMFHKKNMICSNTVKPLKMPKITSILKDVQSAGNFEFKRIRAIQDGTVPGRNGFSFQILPIFSHKGQTLTGHFLLINAKKQMDQNVLRYMTKRSSMAIQHSKQYTEMRNLSYIDDLTEFYNQRYLGMVLDREISRSTRSNSPFSVLFIDVDYFKKVNDSGGHLLGSKLLVELSKILKRNIRLVDYGFRYGGDEYLLLLSNTDANAAKIVGERIRKEVEESIFNVDGMQLKMTLSIGVATFPKHAKTKEQIIYLADQAMYHGKNKSRNIVFVAS